MERVFPSWLRGITFRIEQCGVVLDNTGGQIEWCGLECWCRMGFGQCVRCGRHMEFFLPKGVFDRRDCIGAGVPVELTDVSGDEFRILIRIEDVKVTAQLFEGILVIDTFEATIC